jgi:hypothetical protein
MGQYHTIREQRSALQLEIERLDRELLRVQEVCHEAHPQPMDNQDVFVDKTYWNYICQTCTHSWCEQREGVEIVASTD